MNFIFRQIMCLTTIRFWLLITNNRKVMKMSKREIFLLANLGCWKEWSMNFPTMSSFDIQGFPSGIFGPNKNALFAWIKIQWLWSSTFQTKMQYLPIAMKKSESRKKSETVIRSLHVQKKADQRSMDFMIFMTLFNFHCFYTVFQMKHFLWPINHYVTLAKQENCCQSTQFPSKPKQMVTGDLLIVF